MMKKLLLCFAMFFAGQAIAQSGNDMSGVVKQPSGAKLQTMNATDVVLGGGTRMNKTNSLKDSLDEIVVAWDNDCSVRNGLIRWWNIGTDYHGLVWGSDQSTAGSVGEYGTEFILASNPQAAGIYVEGAFYFFSNFAGQRNKQNGTYDQFAAYLYSPSVTRIGTNPLNFSGTFTQLASRQFTIEDIKANQGRFGTDPWVPSEFGMYDPGNYIEFNQGSNRLTGGKMVASIRVSSYLGNGQYGNDTLNLIAPSERDACDPDSTTEFWAKVYKDSDYTSTNTFSASTRYSWKPWRFVWDAITDDANFTPDSMHAPMIVPVIVTAFTDRKDTYLGSAAGLDLFANYPNPVVVGTTFRFSMAKAGTATIKVMDLQGRLVKKFDNIKAQQGVNEVYMDAQDLGCGTYLYAVETSQGTLASKFQVVK